MSYIYILPIETDPDPWIEPLQKNIHKTFGFYSKVLNPEICLAKTLDLKRLQYNSSQILLQIIQSPPDDAAKVMGVVAVDLFIPILTFVFGEAQLRGIGSIVSMHRLNNKFYGLPENSKLLLERLMKEAVHELGHNFGLFHCTNQRCVMKSSTYVEDIDQKSLEMCARCREQISLVSKG
jgi:archaemetzincin